MKERRKHEWLTRGLLPSSDPAAPYSWLNRLIHSLNFLVVIIFLAAWITSFLLLKEYLSTLSLPGNLVTDLACISFFGGMIIAFLIAAIAGNLVQRFL